LISIYYIAFDGGLVVRVSKRKFSFNLPTL